MRPFQPVPALRDAALYTFSNTRGTPSRNVGWNTCMSRGSVFVFGRYPTTPSAEPIAKYWIMRAKQWASGRNSSRRASPVIAPGKQFWAARVMLVKLRWVSSAPFGAPVEPEV